MILNDVITETRRILQDIDSPQRYSDTLLLGFANQALKRIAVLRPDLFAFVGTLTCVTDAVLQTAPSDSIRIIEVYSVVGGDGVIEVNRETLDQSLPAWMNDTAAAATNWMRHVRNPNKFFIYPKAPAAQQLVVEYAQVPATYDLVTTITLLSDAYLPCLIDATVFLAESVDNEHVNSGRAKLFHESFTQALGVSLRGRIITDTEDSGTNVQQSEGGG